MIDNKNSNIKNLNCNNMKRTFLATFLSIIFAMVAVACHGSDEKEIGYAELPVQAQQFVKQRRRRTTESGNMRQH